MEDFASKARPGCQGNHRLREVLGSGYDPNLRLGAGCKDVGTPVQGLKQPVQGVLNTAGRGWDNSYGPQPGLPLGCPGSH
jgi:hypothetical protein